MHTWHSIGLLPPKGISLVPESCYVVYPTPSTSSVWFTRSLTTCELACLCDLPVDCERRFKTAYRGFLTHQNTLMDGIHLKVLSYDLWFTGYCSDKGVLDIFAQNKQLIMMVFW